MKVILGAGGTTQDGWVSTERHQIDVTKREDFERFFGDEKADAFLMEHLLEHLCAEDVDAALANCYEFMKPFGNLRIAVPDGYHPDKDYIEWVRPGGNGPGCDLHKQLFNRDVLGADLERHGFMYINTEWWDCHGNFNHYNNGSEEERFGRISRSFANDERNADGNPHYTSLIIDAWKEK
jgi:predicted SAM-dependent methyltransferase